MYHLNPNQLALYEFQPNNIIMIQKNTKILYQYFQTPSIITLKQTNIFHQNLLPSIALPTGVVYKKSITTLQTQLSKRLNMKNKIFFQQEQLVNTFLPVIECLLYLHEKDVVHGNIIADSIQFNDEGEVMLKDGRVEITGNKYYQNQIIKDRTNNDDMAAMGWILLECMMLLGYQTMKLEGNVENVLKKVMNSNKYSRGLVMGVYVMIKKMDKYYQNLSRIFANNLNMMNASELLNIERKIRGEKQTKPKMMTSSNLICVYNGVNQNKYLQVSIKTPLTTKKTQQKVQDSENKKNIETTKKNSDRMSKIIEKNSYIKQDKLDKQDGALKKMSNLKLNVGEKDKETEKSIKRMTKEEILKFGSPLKRMRTITKKKC